MELSLYTFADEAFVPGVAALSIRHAGTVSQERSTSAAQSHFQSQGNHLRELNFTHLAQTAIGQEIERQSCR